jgi:hypothetical protein
MCRRRVGVVVVKGRHITLMRRRHHCKTPENTSSSMSRQVRLHLCMRLSMSTDDPISMEIDTGASVSIASRETFELIREGESHLELEEPTVRLQTYTGESIKVCRSTVVKVMHNGQTQSLPLVITEGSGPTLLGRNWLGALRLDWRTIFNIGRDLSLQQVLSQHTEVFREELGKLQGTTAKIHVDGNTCPRFEKPRQVPFAIREKVERELERLQALGILQPVQFSDWATPIVPVSKSDGGVRICGDYKIRSTEPPNSRGIPFPVLKSSSPHSREARHFRNSTSRTPICRFRWTNSLSSTSRSTRIRGCSGIQDSRLGSRRHHPFSRG